uniref:Uncharacterized protein n=1 Tax=Anguilla anguilla TaxID=7936 RepID=A0A0E9UR85_ANGAN
MVTIVMEKLVVMCVCELVCKLTFPLG